MLLNLMFLLLEHALVNLEHFVWLAAELQLLELKRRFNEHKDGNFRFQRESVSR